MKQITQLIKEAEETHFDVLGENMKIGEDVMFYYEDGVKSAEKYYEDNTKTPRLYRGVLKEWDNQKLVGTIESLDFDQKQYKVPKTVKVQQLLILKHKWR